MCWHPHVWPMHVAKQRCEMVMQMLQSVGDFFCFVGSCWSPVRFVGSLLKTARALGFVGGLFKTAHGVGALGFGEPLCPPGPRSRPPTQLGPALQGLRRKADKCPSPGVRERSIDLDLPSAHDHGPISQNREYGLFFWVFWEVQVGLIIITQEVHMAVSTNWGSIFWVSLE